MRPYALSIALLCAGPVCAGEWTITPRFSIAQTYTDNVLLTETGQEGDFVNSITPGLSVRGKSARLNSAIDYNLQQLRYLDKSNLNGNNHQLQAQAEALFIEDWLYFDTNSRMSQQSVDNRGRVTLNNRGDSGNRRDVLSYEWSPRVEHRFGGWADLMVRYYDQTIDSGKSDSQLDPTLLQQLGSSTEQGYDFELGGGPRFGRFPLKFKNSWRETTQESGRVNTFESLSGEAAYIWSRKFRFTATGGKEKNQFDSRSGLSDGPFWSLGGSWTPSPRTTVSGNWGDRFFGKNFNIDASHRHRRWLLTFRYGEDVRTSSQFQRELILVRLVDNRGLPIFDPVTSGQVFIPIDSPTLTDDVFVQTNMNVALEYSFIRTDATVRYFEFDRVFQSGGNSESLRGASLNLSRSLRRRLKLDLGATWRTNTSSIDESKGTFFSIYPSLNYELGPHTTARFQYEYSRNSGSASSFGVGGGGGFASGGFGLGNTNFDRGYVENAVTASLVLHL